MTAYDLSVIIPGRNEEFMDRTIQDVLQHIKGNTEVIAILDGYLPEPPLTPDPRVTIIYNPEAKGQRIASNQAANLSKAKYIMKLDAHCAMDDGFDVKMMADMQDNWTMIPLMRNLHAFDWVCPDGHRRYQGPSGPCKDCGKPTIKDVVWIAKESPKSVGYRFDTDLHFNYWNEIGYNKGDLTETMSIQGSCFMCTRDKYLELDICGEEFHSWGQQGVEVACKTWLSGGQVMVNHKTWYAHMFRTQGGDFSFPYHNPQSKVVENRELSKHLFRDDNWPKATRKFQWLIDKFGPPGWETNGTTKGAIFYTDSELDLKIAKIVQDQLIKVRKDKGIPIVTASLRGLKFGDKNIRFPSLKRSRLTMFKEILGTLENSSADIIFWLEHDVVYSPSHFEFMPSEKDVFYFNNNVWKVDWITGKSIKVDKCEQLSGMCCYRNLALTFVREKIEQMQKADFDGHYEPRGKRSNWDSTEPNIDIRHDKNLTPNRWSKDQFKDQNNTKGWTETDGIVPGWGDVRILFNYVNK
jgi:hypothetical protein